MTNIHTSTDICIFARDRQASKLLIALNQDNNLNKSVDSFQLQGLTALQFAAMGGSLNCAEILVDRGADIHVADDDWRGDTSAHVAASYGNIRVLDMLLARGAVLNRENNIGETILHGVARGGYEAMSLRLLARELILIMTLIHMPLNKVYLTILEFEMKMEMLSTADLLSSLK